MTFGIRSAPRSPAPSAAAWQGAGVRTGCCCVAHPVISRAPGRAATGELGSARRRASPGEPSWRRAHSRGAEPSLLAPTMPASRRQRSFTALDRERNDAAPIACQPAHARNQRRRKIGMSGLGQVEMSGSRYVTGHVGARPDHEQTRVRARSSAAQSARKETHSTQGCGGARAQLAPSGAALPTL
jgi:hypothetical protein